MKSDASKTPSSLRLTLRRLQANLRRRINTPCATALSALLLPFLLNFSLNLYFFSCNAYDGTRAFGGLFFSFLFTLVVYTLFWGLVKRCEIATLLLAVLFFILGVGNQLKMVLSGLNPLFIDDLFFASDISTLSIIVEHADLGAIVLAILPQTLLFFLLLLLTVWLAFFLKVSLPSYKRRLIAAGVSLVLLLLTFLPIKPINQAVINVFFPYDEPYDAIDYYNREGFLSGIVAQYLKNRLPSPTDYSQEAAESLLEAAAEETDSETKDWGRPNIVMIFSESFFDLARLDDVCFSQAITPNYTALKEEGIAFDMLSATFGGLSCNAEYEILTSSNLAFYPLGFTPYTMLYQAQNQAAADYPSLVQELKANGYTTEFVSAWEKNLCNANTVYTHMGVDGFRYDFSPTKKGLYTADEAIGNDIINTLRNKDAETPLFYITMTGQAHMPYYADKYETYDLAVTSSPLNEEQNAILLSYAQGVYDADRMLAEVYAYIQTLEEPTLLIFYGDHLPNLSDGEASFYDRFAYFSTDNALLNEARRYTTQGLILANFPLEDDVDYLGQDLLMPYVLSHCSLTLSPYYRYLASTIDSLPCFNTFAAYDSDGTLCALDALDEKQRRIYWERRNLNAYLFRLTD